ncbi:MAG: hypothetical protein ACLUN5_14025 [Oscillospiraceae bacterium]
MMKKAVSFRPIVDIQQFITENICDIPDKPDIEAMQQNIRDYKRHEHAGAAAGGKADRSAGDRQTLYREMNQAIDRWQVQSFLVLLVQKRIEASPKLTDSSLKRRDCTAELAATEKSIRDDL